MMRRAFATAGWMHADSSKRLWDHLKEQAKLWLKYKPWWPIELAEGRPQVVATKFSSRSPDVGSNPAKKAIDMLTPARWTNRAEHKFTKHRLGVIKDDRPECVEQVHHWELLPAEYPAFILLEVRI